MAEYDSSDGDCSEDEGRSQVKTKRQTRSVHLNVSILKEDDTSSREGWSQSNWIMFQKQFDGVSQTRPMILLYFDEGEEKIKCSSHFREQKELRKMKDIFKYMLTGETKLEEGMDHIEMEEVLQMLDVDPTKSKVEELRDLYKKLCNTIFKRTKSKNFWTDANKPEGWPLEHFQGPDNAGKGKNGHRLKQAELRKVIIWFQERYGPNGLNWKQPRSTLGGASDTKIPSLPPSGSLLSVESGLGNSVLTIFSPPGSSTYTPGPKSVKTPGPPNTPLNKTPKHTAADVRVHIKPRTPLPKTPKSVPNSENSRTCTDSSINSVADVATSLTDVDTNNAKKRKIESYVSKSSTPTGILTTPPKMIKTEQQLSSVDSNSEKQQQMNCHSLQTTDLPGNTNSNSLLLNTTVLPSSVGDLNQSDYFILQQLPALSTTNPPTHTATLTLSQQHPPCSSIPTPTLLTANLEHQQRLAMIESSTQTSSNTAMLTSSSLATSTAASLHPINTTDHYTTSTQQQQPQQQQQQSYYIKKETMSNANSSQISSHFNENFATKTESVAPSSCVISEQKGHSTSTLHQGAQNPLLQSTGFAHDILLTDANLLDINTVELFDEDSQRSSGTLGSRVPSPHQTHGYMDYSENLLTNTQEPLFQELNNYSLFGTYNTQTLVLNGDPFLSTNQHDQYNTMCDSFSGYSSSGSSMSSMNSHSNHGNQQRGMYRSLGKKGGKGKRVQQAAQKRPQQNTTSGMGKRMRRRGK